MKAKSSSSSRGLLQVFRKKVFEDLDKVQETVS